MSFKCSGAFNIIYIMRTIIAEGESSPQRESVIQPATSHGERNEHTYREIRHLRNIVFANGLSKCFSGGSGG